MRAAFMGLVSELPDGWHDESTMTFTIPHIDVGEGQMLSPGNVVINWVDGSHAEPEDYLADLHHQLQESFDNFETLEEGELAPQIPFIRFQFEAGRDLQQILAVRRIGNRMVIVTGTAMGEYFDRYREQFVGVARSLKSA